MFAINEEIKFAMEIERAKRAHEKRFRIQLIREMFEKDSSSGLKWLDVAWTLLQ